MSSSKSKKPSVQEQRDLLALHAARIIFVLWLISTVAQRALPYVSDVKFDPPPAVDGLMVVVAGWLYATPLLRKGNGNARGNSDHHDDGPSEGSDAV